MRDKHVIYEHTQKYRAETFRFAGYALFTPLGMILLRLLLEPVELTIAYHSFWIQLMTAVVAAIIGFRVIVRGNTIMVKLDESLNYECK